MGGLGWMQLHALPHLGKLVFTNPSGRHKKAIGLGLALGMRLALGMPCPWFALSLPLGCALLMQGLALALALALLSLAQIEDRGICLHTLNVCDKYTTICLD